jgi:hypothetical protein
MSRRLFQMANEAAEGEDLIYAPDAAAMAWMRKFSKMVTLTERERCAALCEDLGYTQAAEAIRRGEE